MLLNAEVKQVQNQSFQKTMFTLQKWKFPPCEVVREAAEQGG